MTTRPLFRLRHPYPIHLTVAVVVALMPAPAGVVGADETPQRGGGERAAREIDLAIEALGLRPGDAVAEIGAGNARFSFRFAEVVGPKGRVYANELSSSRGQRIQKEAERRSLANLTAVEGAVDDTKLPDAQTLSQG